MWVFLHELVFDDPELVGIASDSIGRAHREALRTGIYTVDTADSGHFSQQSCRILTSNALDVIAHELGHCFGLRHNEDDPNPGVDLMASGSGGRDWIKTSNRALVRRFFRPIVQRL